MKLPRRKFVQFAGAALAAPASSRLATAQTYPSRPVTMIVPYPPGGTTDAIARVLAERMKSSLKQPIIIENVSGANGSIGTGRAAHARPDGYTIELGGQSTHVLNGVLYSLPYDVLQDFAPISPLVPLPFVLFARKVTPAKDLNELIAWLKSNPNRASAGIAGTGLRLEAAFFQKETATQFTLVPYRGGALQDLVAERQREHRRKSSANSTRPPCRHWPIRRCDLGWPIWGWKFFHANGRRRRRSTRW